MIVLHAGVDGGVLLVWAEMPGTPTTTPEDGTAPRPRGRKALAEVPPTQPHPGDAGAARLAWALVGAVPGMTLSGDIGEPVTLWLPTLKGQPTPSSPLLGPPPPATARLVLAPWQVTSVRLNAAQTVDLLCACLGRETLGSGVVVGSTLVYWTWVLRFAAALVAREAFVPGVRKTGANWEAVWQPLLLGPDGRRLADLGRHLPAACRAFTRGQGGPPTRAPVAVVEGVLDTLVDNLVRSAVAEEGRRPGTTFPSLHDQWLQALRAPDPTLRGEERELAELAAQARSWQRPLTVSTAAPFHLCFRLEAPESEEDAWLVRYLLQANDDPSLIVPLAHAWKPRANTAAVFEARGFAPREYLLTSLGQAAALCPPVEGSLKSATPAWFRTDAAGAHRFLSESAWLLEQAGFGVMVPAWWTKHGTAVRLNVQAEAKPVGQGHGSGAAMQGTSGISLQQMISFNWKVALGDDLVSLEELEALARLKAPLVQFRGQWVQVEAGELRTAIELMKKRSGGQATLRDVVHMALGAGQGPGGLPFGGVTAKGWLSELLSQLKGDEPFAELPVPDTFQGTLRPYQVRGYSWLAFLRRWGLGACLADDMGLGKTIQTLALIERDWPLTQRPTLLICPTSVVGNWKKEAERFTPDLPVHIHHGGGRVKGKAFAQLAERHALVLSSYALLFRDRELLTGVKWAGVVLDEAQNIKNSETKQAQAARALPADFRIALTGTPVENHVGDLWSILEFLNPGLLGTQAEFRRRFFIPIQAQHDEEAAKRLKQLSGPFILRRLKTDRTIIADLPEKMEMKVYATLTREQATLYAAVVEDLERSLKEAEGIKRHGVILGTLMKLKQVCNHPAHFLGDNSPIPSRSGKLTRLTEMLEEVIEAGEKALVFTQFTEMGEILKTHLQETLGREVLFLHGGVSRDARGKMVDRFQNDPAGPRIFLLSLKAGGTGLNLTAATHVFHFDRWWNPAVEDQATDRAFRIGQTRNVQVHKFVCVGTLEEKIDDMIAKKQAVAARVVSAGEAWLTDLSNDQLKDLLTLRRDALGEE